MALQRPPHSARRPTGQVVVQDQQHLHQVTDIPKVKKVLAKLYAASLYQENLRRT